MTDQQKYPTPREASLCLSCETMDDSFLFHRVVAVVPLLTSEELNYVPAAIREATARWIADQMRRWAPELPLGP